MMGTRLMGTRGVERRTVPLALVAMFLGLVLSLLSGWVGAQAGPLSSGGDDWPEWRGVVESMPSGGLTGTWVVAGRTFQADSGTQFEQSHGSFQVGACVEVKYQTTSGSYRAVKMETKESSDCGNSGGGGGGSHENKAYGTIDSMPSGGLTGTWVIGGVTYTADASTYFEQEHGGFAVGRCVEVEFTPGTPNQAVKIGTESAYKCAGSGGSGGGNHPQGELYGVIESMPSGGLIGAWTIGGMEFMTDSSTQFEQEHGSFAPGVLVEVKFYTDSNNVNHAIKIESKYATDHHGDDDDGNGSYEGHEGHAYGLVEAMPASGRMGAWTIGGIQYQADSGTRFEEEHGQLTVGSRVKVKYYLDANNNRVALKIETTNETGGSTDPSHYKLYGFVEAMPAGGFNGQWTINGVAFMADQTTFFQEEHGLLAVGAYVEVEYTKTNGANWIVKIETHVPPGAGSNSFYGTIQNVSSTGAAADSAVNTTWVIGGRSYVVTPATDLNDARGALTPGSTALVNSYTDASGNEVATQVRGLLLDKQIFLPVAMR